MPIRKAKPIDALFKEVRGSDLVLTPDAPLALALNRRIERPRLGHFAVTPRNYARQGLELPDKRALFHEVIARTDLAWKRAARTLEMVLRCWEETGDREAILGYGRFDREASRAVCQVLADIPSSHRARERVTIPDDLDVAVIGESQLSPLDRKVLPDRYTVIDPFDPGGSYEPEPFRVLPSTKDLLSVLEAHITPENADEVGIVLHPASPLRAMVESMLEARSIPYRTEESLTEDRRLRAFLHLMRLGLSSQRLRVRDVRGVLRELGVPVPAQQDDKLIEHLGTGRLEELKAFWARLEGGRFAHALDAFETLSKQPPRDLRDLFTDLGLLDAPVHRSVLDGLDYYLDTFDVETERKREGVLLASAVSNAYVDASTVFYLGMDAAWSQEVEPYPWIDRTSREQQNRARFELLLQNGDLPVYLVQDTHLGDPVTPCFHLHELLEVDFERFTDLPHERVIAPQRELGEGFEHHPIELPAEPEPIETISASKLNLLAYCPRDYLFDVLVRTPEKDYFEQGNLFHEFAEVVANHPDAIDAAGAAQGQLGELADRMLDELSPFTEAEDRAPLRSKLVIGMQNILAWLQANPPEPVSIEGYSRSRGTNRVAEWLGLDLEPTSTEQWFEAPELGLKGKVDLLRAREHIVDHKSSAYPENARRIAMEATPGMARDRPEFQPAVYLTHHRARTKPEHPVRFTLLHFLANADDRVRGAGELSDLERTVTYVPQRFEAWVASRDAFETVQDSNERERVLSRFGYARWVGFFEDADLPAFESKSAIVDSELSDAFVAAGKSVLGDHKYVENVFPMTLKRLVEERNGAFYAEDLDAFETFVADQLERLNTYREGRFPIGDADLSKVVHQDLILRRL